MKALQSSYISQERSVYYLEPREKIGTFYQNLWLRLWQCNQRATVQIHNIIP